MSGKELLPRKKSEIHHANKIYLECNYCHNLVEESDITLHTQNRHPGVPVQCVTQSLVKKVQNVSTFDRIFGTEPTPPRQKSSRARSESSSSLSPDIKKLAVSNSPLRKDSKEPEDDTFKALLSQFHSIFPNVHQERENQLPPIKAIFNGFDTVSVCFTGFGKSLLFLISGYLRYMKSPDAEKPHVCILIYPLVSLLQDQLNKLVDWKFLAVEVTEEANLTNLPDGKLSFILVSPETAEERWFRLKLKDLIVHLIVIDEVHVLDTWGNSFRESFNSLGELKFFCKSIIAAFTATLTSQQLQDISKKLRLTPEVKIFCTPIQKKNIYLDWKTPSKVNLDDDDEFEDLQWIIQHVKTKKEKCQKILIFTDTISQCSRIFLFLFSELHEVEMSNVVDMYTGIHSKNTKNVILQNFVPFDSKIRILVTTAAYSMGVDTKNLNIVINYDKFKKKPESERDDINSRVLYIQMIGRIARAGEKSVGLRFCPKSFIPAGCIHEYLMSALKWEKTEYEVLKTETIALRDCNGNCSKCFCKYCSCCSFCIAFCKCKKTEKEVFESVLIN